MSQEKCIQKKHLAFTAIIIVPFPISVIILKFANLNEKKKKKQFLKGNLKSFLLELEKRSEPTYGWGKKLTLILEKKKKRIYEWNKANHCMQEGKVIEVPLTYKNQP